MILEFLRFWLLPEYYFIVDDPSKSITNLQNFASKYADHSVQIIQNERNLGASASRNKGIEKSRGEYILFLDDDCIVDSELITQYVQALEQYPNYLGYIGLTDAPEAASNFDKAVMLSDMRHFFEIAKHKDTFYWGITANLFIKRAAINGIRFSLDHPKKGGGEDIAFCLKVLPHGSNYKKSNPNIEKAQPSNPNIRNSHNSQIKTESQAKSEYQKKPKLTRFKCLPSAKVVHPFWEESLRAYLRF